MTTTKLLIQPGAGIGPLIAGIDGAREIIQIVIFRFDRGDVEMALKRAAKRGVFVHALVAHTSSGQGGEQLLRKLEMRLLADGISVARTATDLVRYHDKLMIVDKKLLFMLGFNYTYLDTERSRSFGIVTEHKEWVQEAEKLFTADILGQAYTPECDSFLVSPGNSRSQLLDFLSKSQREVLIYDGKLFDPEAIAILNDKVRDGVDVRVIGAVGKSGIGISVARPNLRLHAQTIVRDGERLYLGSQSLRPIELDARREVGLLVSDIDITRQVQEIFEADWAKIQSARKSVMTESANTEPAIAAQTESNGGAPVQSTAESTQIVQSAVKEAIVEAVKETLLQNADSVPLKSTMKEAVKEALAELSV